MLQLIDESDIKDKKKYSGILRAQLSSCEQAILFYDCIWYEAESKSNKFRDYIIKYQLLNNFPKDLLLDNILDEGIQKKDELQHKDLYPPEAYGDST